MKSLTLLRHAKTERNNPRDDHARELTARGRDDAASIAGLIAEGMAPDLILTSTAVRAVQTAEIVRHVLGATVDISADEAIYLSSLDELVGVVHALPADVDTVVLVGHNPGFLDLMNWFLPPEEAREHLPTAAFVVVESKDSRWTDLNGPARVSVSPIFTP